MTHRHFEQRLKELESDYDLLSEKIGRYRRQLVIETGLAVRFQLEKELEQAEAEREALTTEIDQLNRAAEGQGTSDKWQEVVIPPLPLPLPELQLIDQAAKQGRLVLWLGGDAPAGLTGRPSRQELADKLAAQHGLPAGRNLAWVAQQVMAGGNRWLFTDFLLAELGQPSPPQPFHHQIVQWVRQAAIKTIILTAYDNLLKRAFEMAGMAVNWVIADSNLAFTRPERPTLLKLYGDLEFVDSLVISEQDHTALIRGQSRPAVLQQAAQLIRSHTVLFVGHDPSDPTITTLLDGWLNGPFAIPAYAIWTGLSGREKSSLASNRHLTILETEPFACLKWLNQA